MQISA
jgi:DNA replication protein DnaC